MARDGSGTFSLPLPDVVAGTDIEASWANTTLTDIETELTDSLSRTGKGGMSAALKLASGTVSAPGLSFTSEANSGLYREAAGDVRGVVGGAPIWRMTSAGFQQYISAAWTSSVNTTGAQTVAGVKTFSDHVTPGVAGKGIDFSIQTATAATGAATTNEVLSHYEAGTWTPNVWDATLSSSEGQTYDVQAGIYTRIGRVVFFNGYLQMTSPGTLTTTDQVYIGPLPFTSISYVAQGGISINFLSGITLTSAFCFTGDVRTNANYVRLWVTPTSGTAAICPISRFGATSSIGFNGFYFV